MLYKVAKEDVLNAVIVELGSTFDKLTNHYSRPEFTPGLTELEKIEAYLKAKLLEYDPDYVPFPNGYVSPTKK